VKKIMNEERGLVWEGCWRFTVRKKKGKAEIGL
jgi:hypothetical protein